MLLKTVGEIALVFIAALFGYFFYGFFAVQHKLPGQFHTLFLQYFGGRFPIIALKVAAQLGKGTYLRSLGMTKLDFEKQDYTIPLGLGIGQVLKVGSTMHNFILEPQYDIYSNVAGKPAFTLFTGINMQFL